MIKFLFTKNNFLTFTKIDKVDLFSGLAHYSTTTPTFNALEESWGELKYNDDDIRSLGSILDKNVSSIGNNTAQAAVSFSSSSSKGLNL